MTPPESTSAKTLPDGAYVRAPAVQPKVPDHELVRRIGQGSYGEVWLARSAVGTYRAVKLVFRSRFKDERPYEREFSGIQKYEPISRTNEGLVDVLQIGRNDAEGYFYYVMELADDAGAIQSAEVAERGKGETPGTSASSPLLRHATPPALQCSIAYVPKTLAREIQARGRLPVEECITLGLNLNLALGHLHRTGLIHRDLKPSNIIFVSGVPKLADIGLVTEVSEAQSFVGTEGFIPPEGPNSPQADIYALGKVLYEASMGKGRHEFPEPCSGLGTDPNARALMELNAVLLKACAPNPRDRYRSAEEMNADLALLHSGQSVQQKHVLQRRVKVLTRAGVALAAVLVLAAFPYYLAIREAHRASAAANNEKAQRQKAQASEKKARAEAAKSEQVARFLQEMLQGVGPSVAQGRDITILREILDKTAARVSIDLTNQPDVEAEICGTLRDVYDALGLYTSAEDMARRALALEQSLAKESPDVAACLNQLGGVLWHEQRLDEAEEMFRQAITLGKKVSGDDSGQVASSLNNLTCVLLDRRRFKDAEDAERAALPVLRKAFGDESRQAATGLGLLGVALHNQGKLSEAEERVREALALWKRLVGPEDSSVALTLNNLGQVLSDAGKLPEAENALREALAIDRKILGKHPNVANELHNLGSLLNEQGRLEEALVVDREALDMDRELLPNGHPRIAGSLRAVAAVLMRQGKHTEAEPLIRESLAIYRKSSPDDIETFIAESMLGKLLLKQTDYAQAEPLLLSGYQGLKQRAGRIPLPDGKFIFRQAIGGLVELYESSARPDQAAQWRQRLAELDQPESSNKSL